MKIQLFYNSKNKFAKYHPVCPKNPKLAFFWNTLYIPKVIIIRITKLYHSSNIEFINFFFASLIFLPQPLSIHSLED